MAPTESRADQCSSPHRHRPASHSRLSPALMSPRHVDDPDAQVRHDLRARPSWTDRRLSTGIAALPALLFALLLAVSVTPAAAVNIPFANCLPGSYKNSDPPPLQWVPLHADAAFNHHDGDYTLRMIVWGNVTGSYNRADLPAANDSYWSNDNKTNGKIIRFPEEDTLATTLYRQVNVLNYEPWNNGTDLCESGLVNATCPLAPVFDSNASVPPYDLPSINMTHDFSSSYSFTSFATTLLVIYGDTKATNIGCISATITPELGGLSRLLKYIPLVILLLSGLAVILAATFSPWGSIDVFHWTSNYGRDADLLRLVTPGFGDCLQYIQFIALTGGLSLEYPGFYQPIVSQLGWSALMFNESFVSKAPSFESVVDGIYVTDAKYGLQQLGQLVGMAKSEDIWAGMMVWLCVIVVGVFVLVEFGFLAQWLMRRLSKTPEEDLRAKNIPFSIGNVVRIMFHYMLLPLVALSCFQLVTAPSSPKYVVALAAVTILLLVGFAGWLLFLVISTRPKSVLFDDLPTVLLYGPLYNTFSDGQAAFAIAPVVLTFTRGIAIGAVQPSGVAQLVILAICEVILILTLQAIRPYPSPTSMNAYHTVFAVLRLVTILLMVVFAPSLGVTEGPKGWIGYVILLIHGIVLVLGFFLNALQTIVEVVARMMGAGGDTQGGLTRGGLAKIFGMRELSRRETHREGPSRASQLSTSAMLDVEEGGKSGYAMPSGRVRSGSAASMGGMAGGHHRHRSSSVLDSVDAYSRAGHRTGDTASSYMPGTPGDASTFSFLASPTAARQGPPPASMEASDPYYRPPRRRNDALTDSMHSDMQDGALGIDMRQIAQASGPPGEVAEMDADQSRGMTPAPPAGGNLAGGVPPNRPDYSTREVDFYYGVRGPALNSDGPGRKLGTGPADPTGPLATATGWFRNILGGKSKEKGKGFEVVRSSRMPPGMAARNGGFGDETPPEGIPVTKGVLRNGPIDSDDDDEPKVRSPKRRKGDLLSTAGNPEVSDPDESDTPTSTQKSRGFSRGQRQTNPDDVSDDEDEDDDVPGIPRKSSKRHSNSMTYLQLHLPTLSLVESENESNADPGPSRGSTSRQGHSHNLSATSHLPFERTGSQKRLSSKSSMEFPGEFTQVELRGNDDERPASFGVVPHHEISRVDPEPRQVDLVGSSAELVDESKAAKSP